MWEAFGRGRLVDLRVSDPEANNPAHADSWDESRRVRAEVVAALLLGAVDPVAGCVPGVRLKGAVVEGRVDAGQGVVAYAAELTGCCFIGGVLLAEARTRTVDFSGSVLETLDATAAEIGGNLTLDRCQAQAISLGLAHITGNLSLDGAHLTNPGKDALYADLITVGGRVNCHDGFRVEGEVRLIGAHIIGDLSLDGAHLINPRKDALSADRIIVGGSVFCRDHFRVEGEVRLISAQLSAHLWLDGAQLTNPSRDALSGDGMTVGGGVFCQEGFRAEGDVRLPGAHIDSQVVFRKAVLSNPGGLALDCESMEADSLWFDPVTVTGTVDLTSVRARVLHDDPDGWPGQMILDRFVYDDLRPYVAPRGPAGRLSWLEHAETSYRAQPYEQLAAYYRRLGHDREARQVLLAKQRRRRAEFGFLRKIFGYTLDGLVGYGYVPNRAFAWLVVLFTAGSVYFTLNRPAPLDPTQHPHYQPVLYAADQLIPVVNLGQAGIWAPAGAAQWVAAALVALGWILVTAVVAGITRVLTRT